VGVIFLVLQANDHGNWSNYETKLQLDGTLHKEHKAMRAVCAAVVLDLRVRSTKDI